MKKCHERTNKLFSVVIPNYKRTHELKRAIDSVLRQDGYDDLIENIFIVDDKSENIDEIEVIINDYNRKEIILIK
ncbi:glycosyltransferase family 2 protein, partial [Klebsiella pneumoniae]